MLQLVDVMHDNWKHDIDCFNRNFACKNSLYINMNYNAFIKKNDF